MQRDRPLHDIAEHGRAAWQKASGYTKRARAEAAIDRFKQVIGDGLRSRTDERRATEVDVAVHVLNRMLELGRRSPSVPPEPERAKDSCASIPGPCNSVVWAAGPSTIQGAPAFNCNQGIVVTLSPATDFTVRAFAVRPAG